MKKVIILGAGIAGLAAAHELAKNGFQVEIVEASSEIGGLAKNSHYKGFTFDMGPHRIYSESPETMQFIRELCGNELLSVPRKSRMRLKGRYYQYPPQAKELLRHLPPTLGLKFVASYFSSKLTPKSKKADDSNYAGYLINRFGKAMCDFFFLPYAKKLWGISPTEIHADIARLRLSQKNLTDTIKEIVKGPSPDKPKTAIMEFYYPEKGVGVIAEGLAEQVVKLGVEIHCSTKVTELKVERSLYGNTVTEVICETAGGQKRFSCDKVISTIPLSTLVGLTHPENQELVMVSKSLRHRSILLICLLIRKPHISDDHWLYFPEEDFHITRIHQPKNFSAALCPPNKSSLVGEVTCFPDDSRWNSTDMEIYDFVLGDFLASELIHETDIEDYHIVRIRNAYPIYDSNYQTKLNQIFQYLRTLDNLITTGRQGLFHHNNIDHSIIMGQAAAQNFQSPSASTRDWYDKLNEFDRFRVVD
jgi:protoporphyrinogen oxidase